MAGEIGASVIVVKEIEVPPAVVALADKVSAYIDPQTGEWTEKMTNKRHRAVHVTDSDATLPLNGGDTETEADDSDSDETCSAIATPEFLPELGSGIATLVPYAHRLSSSNPIRPTAQSSPSIYPIDDDLALFSMEPEPSLDDNVADEEELVPDGLGDIPDLSLDIEITSVYKPRPMRRRVHLTSGPVAAVARPQRRAHKNKDKKREQPWHSLDTGGTVSAESLAPVPANQEDKALQRRIARDKRREEKRTAALALAGHGIASSAPQLSASSSFPACGGRATSVSSVEDSVALVAESLQSLHVDVQTANAVVIDSAAETTPGSSTVISHALEVPSHTAVEAAAKTLADAKEPRLIVEALVVRKMSLEEGFLNFEGLE